MHIIIILFIYTLHYIDDIIYDRDSEPPQDDAPRYAERHARIRRLRLTMPGELFRHYLLHGRLYAGIYARCRLKVPPPLSPHIWRFAIVTPLLHLALHLASPHASP